MSNGELLKGRVKGRVYFVHYQDGNLIYTCEDGFEFPVPLNDAGHTRFLAQDKAMLYMRWIRKHMEVIAKAQIDSAMYGKDPV